MFYCKVKGVIKRISRVIFESLYQLIRDVLFLCKLDELSGLRGFYFVTSGG